VLKGASCGAVSLVSQNIIALGWTPSALQAEAALHFFDCFTITCKCMTNVSTCMVYGP
jgi:hypothetical protein